MKTFLKKKKKLLLEKLTNNGTLSLQEHNNKNYLKEELQEFQGL